jgi:hypothetical protein
MSGIVTADLADRWRRARIAALASLLPATDTRASNDELALLTRALAVDGAEAYRRVFDNSLRLGQGCARWFGHEPALGELPALLSELQSSCLRGQWQPCEGEAALTLSRIGCEASGACDYWREAIDGLVLGLSGGIRHARHHSCGHGGSSCVDVIYVDPESPLRFGSIPEPMQAGLERVRGTARHFDSSIDVKYLGVSEGVLLYQIERSGCGGELDVGAVIEKGLRKRFPDLALREISPRPVLEPTG